MSVQAMGDVWAHSTYSGDVQVILLAIADVVNDTYDNHCWAGRAVLAAKANVSERTVTRSLARLVEDGWLTLIAPAARGRTAEYQFHLPAGMGRQSVTSSEALGRQPARNGETNPVSSPITNSMNPSGPDGPSDVPHETTRSRSQAGRALQATRTRRTSLEADALAREVWEHLNPRPMLAGDFPAFRQLIDKALKAGWSAAEIKRAAPNVDTWASWCLQRELRKVRGRGVYDPDAG